jgi:hypothetical protein
VLLLNFTDRVETPLQLRQFLKIEIEAKDTKKIEALVQCSAISTELTNGTWKERIVIELSQFSPSLSPLRLTAVVDKRASLLDPFRLPVACFSPFYLFSLSSLSLPLSFLLVLYRDQEFKRRLLNGVPSNHDSHFSAV